MQSKYNKIIHDFCLYFAGLLSIYHPVSETEITVNIPPCFLVDILELKEENTTDRDKELNSRQAAIAFAVAAQW